MSPGIKFDETWQASMADSLREGDFFEQQLLSLIAKRLIIATLSRSGRLIAVPWSMDQQAP